MEIAHRIVEALTGHLLVFLTFALGLSLGPGELRASLRTPAYRRGLVVALVAVPLLTALVVAVLPLSRGSAGLLLLMAVCPGVAIMVNTIRKRGGDLALGAALSLTLTVAAIALLPVTLALLDRIFGFAFHAAPGPLLRQVALPVLVATGAGLLVRRRLPGVAGRLFPISMALFKIALAVALVVLGVKGVPMLLREPAALLATLLITISAAAIGHAVGGPGEAERRTLAVAAAYGNPMLVLAVVKLSYPDIDALPLVGAYLLVRSAALGGYLAWLAIRHGSRSPGRSPHAPPSGSGSAYPTGC